MRARPPAVASAPAPARQQTGLLRVPLAPEAGARGRLVPLLEDDRVEDLRRLSDLLSRVAGGHELLESRLAEYVATQGKEVVLSSENQADPLLFVHRLLALKDKFDGIIAQATTPPPPPSGARSPRSAQVSRDDWRCPRGVARGSPARRVLSSEDE